MKRLSIKELVQFCKGMKGKNRKESESLAEKYGIPIRYAEDLRVLLGMTKVRPENFDPDIRKEILDKVREGRQVSDISKEYAYKGVTNSLIYGWCRRYRIDCNVAHSFWTERKIMTLCQMIRQGLTAKEMASKLGCSEKTASSMRYRINTGYGVGKWAEVIKKFGFKISKQKGKK